MWKVYVILGIWIQSLRAQQNVYITNSRTGGEKNIYSEYNYTTHLPSRSNNNTGIHLPQLSSLTYNTDLRNSFGNTYALAENHLLSHTKETGINKTQQYDYTHIENNLLTKSTLFDVSSITTESSTAWKITSGHSFNGKLFDIMSSTAQHKNLVYSPISMQTILAFIFTISDGKLYEELAQLLAISNNSTYVAKVFENILQTATMNMPPTTLIMANKLYYDYRFGPIDHSVRNFAKKSFDSEMEQIDFLASKKAANIINLWVSERTHNLIKDIVTSSTISRDTSALLLNSIYFKSEWLTKFASDDTETQDFFMTKQTQVPVDMMYNEDVFRYADILEDLQASVIELPYKTSNLSMLLILPKETEGLAELEKKLRYYNFDLISQKLKREIVIVKLPKFKIEYEIDMIKPLQEMGLYALFNNAASIKLFQNQQKSLKIDQFKHKSFINVNEAGTEATATTVAKYIPLSIPSNMKYFMADHPFVFVIRNSSTTFFIGHVVKF